MWGEGVVAQQPQDGPVAVEESDEEGRQPGRRVRTVVAEPPMTGSAGTIVSQAWLPAG